MPNILDPVSGSQQIQTVTIVENFRAVQSAALFGVKGSETESLTLTLCGGTYLNGSAFVQLAEQAVTLVANATNYIEATTAGVVSANQSAFTAGRIRLYTFTIAAGGGIDFANYVDYRTYSLSPDLAVSGPASATDNAVARFDGTTGKLLQNSVVTISDTGDILGAISLSIGSALRTFDDGAGTIIPVLQVNGTTAAGSALALSRWTTTSGEAPTLIGAKAAGASIGTHGAVALGHDLLLIMAQGSDGSAFQTTANLLFECGGTVSAGVVPGLVRLLTASAAGTLAEAIRWNLAQQTVLQAAAVGTPALCFSNSDLTTGYYRPGANQVGLAVSGAQVALWSSTGLAITGSISTTDPATGAGPLWQLGIAASVSPTAPNRTLRVSIAGTSYYVHAKTTND